LLNITDSELTDKEDQETKAAQANQVEQNQNQTRHEAAPSPVLNKWADGCRKRKRDQNVNDHNMELP